jgi:ABC-type transport system substrate-binding protein
LKRNSVVAICIVLIILVSAVTVIWLENSKPPVQDALELRTYPSISSAIQALLHGEVDLLPIDRFDLETIKPIENTSQVKLVSVPSFDFTYIGLNLRNPPLNDSNVRRAMLYAFDRPDALNHALGAFAESLDPGLFPSAYSTDGWTRYGHDRYGYNTTIASKLLDLEGFILNKTSQEPFRINPSNGEPLRLMSIISRLSEPDEVATADIFAKNMQSVGLPIISLPLSDADFAQSLRTYTFDIFIDSSSNKPAPTWLYTMFDSENNIAPVPLGSNVVGYDNSTFDKYAAQVITANNQEAAQNAAEMCQEILASDLPVLPVFSKGILVAARSDLNVTRVIGSVEETIRETAVNAVQNPRTALPLRIGFASEFESLDPTTTSNNADWTALHLVTEPLLKLDQNGNIKPDILQWTQSYNTLTFRIRSNARFYDGQNITANDVAATLNWLISNVKPSSHLYPLLTEINRIDLIDKSTLKISLTSADESAVYGFTDLFALPASRLSSEPNAPDFLASQLLVSSGPFVLREFTQSEGVYMQLNSQYFGKPIQTLQNFNAYESVGIMGTQLISGSLVGVPSSQLIIQGQPVENATYLTCVYDQDGVPTQCATGTYTGQGAYSSTYQIDSRFHSGNYRVESTLEWSLPTGSSILFVEQIMTVQPLPVLTALILVAIIVFVIAAERNPLRALLGIKRKRETSRRVRRRHKKT